MRPMLALITVFSVFSLLTACKDNPAQEYGTNLSRTLESSKKAAAVADLDALKKAVEAFRTENGRNPDDLSELQRFTGKPIDTGRFTYNSQTGTVSAR